MILLLWRAIWQYLQKLQIYLPFDPAILILGIYPVYVLIIYVHMIQVEEHLLKHYL
jgi:hypothetical protein